MGVSYLLDTHVLLWLLGDANKVPSQIRGTLADPSVELIVSAVSALEVATKTRLKKLPDAGLVSAWHRRVEEIGATSLPISVEHSLLAGSMSWLHRDPFDRLLAAQAITEGCVLVTVDRAFGELTAPQLLTW